MPGWSVLPLELRQIILEALARQTKPGCGACASVCKEWQAILEKEFFRQLKLQVSCLDDMEAMIGAEQVKLVKQIWLNIALKPYTCRCCPYSESGTWACGNNKVVREAITKLFSILSRWPGDAGLTLEISIQSPSDREHCFKNLCFGDNSKYETTLNGRRICTPDRTHEYPDNHGWKNGRQVDSPDSMAISRIFSPLSFKFPDVPQVKAVTHFVIRRQCRRQIEPKVLGYIFDKLPQLKSLVYEPWRSWTSHLQYSWDLETVEYISLFEETNEAYVAVSQKSPFDPPESIRAASSAVSAAFAKRSLGFTQLSVSSLVEASDFFSSCKQGWVWRHLKSLILTSRKLTRTENLETTVLLRTAAKTALSMPQLRTMVLWNGRKGEAFKFFYHATTSGYACIGWRGTWEFELRSDIKQAWQGVQHNLRVIQEPRISTEVESHAHAIELLDLPPGVVDPISVWQMQKEAQLSWYNNRT
ncbi:hypothetical protein LY76DRAFT_519398 [Colletotrichum caudatum]|nr:hypothetical protein LY76DRAFT_519398 [Colletotrichum caudatum]